MKTETREIYNCDYCSRYYKQKHHAKYHESICKMNPVNIPACFSCIHLGKENVGAINHPFAQDGEVFSVNVFYCNHLKQCMHTPINAAKGNKFELDDWDNVLMPVKCEHFQSHNTDSLIDSLLRS